MQRHALPNKSRCLTRYSSGKLYVRELTVTGLLYAFEYLWYAPFLMLFMSLNHPKTLRYTTHHGGRTPTGFHWTTAGVQSQIEILYIFHIVFQVFFLYSEPCSVPFCPLHLTHSSQLLASLDFFAACHSWSVCHTSSNITQYVPSHGYRSSQPAGSLTQAYCRPKPCPKPYTAVTTLRRRTLIVWCVHFNKSGIVPNRIVPFGTKPPPLVVAQLFTWRARCFKRRIANRCERW